MTIFSVQFCRHISTTVLRGWVNSGTELHFEFPCCSTFAKLHYHNFICINPFSISKLPMQCKFQILPESSGYYKYTWSAMKPLCQELREQTLFFQLVFNLKISTRLYSLLLVLLFISRQMHYRTDFLYYCCNFSFNIKTLHLVRARSFLLRLHAWNSILDMH